MCCFNEKPESSSSRRSSFDTSSRTTTSIDTVYRSDRVRSDSDSDVPIAVKRRKIQDFEKSSSKLRATSRDLLNRRVDLKKRQSAEASTKAKGNFEDAAERLRSYVPISKVATTKKTGARGRGPARMDVKAESSRKAGLSSAAVFDNWQSSPNRRPRKVPQLKSSSIAKDENLLFQRLSIQRKVELSGRNELAPNPDKLTFVNLKDGKAMLSRSNSLPTIQTKSLKTPFQTIQESLATKKTDRSEIEPKPRNDANNAWTASPFIDEPLFVTEETQSPTALEATTLVTSDDSKSTDKTPSYKALQQSSMKSHSADQPPRLAPPKMREAAGNAVPNRYAHFGFRPFVCCFLTLLEVRASTISLRH